MEFALQTVANIVKYCAVYYSHFSIESILFDKEVEMFTSGIRRNR